MFYESQKYARSLGFLFLKGGLKNRHACLYLSCQPVQDAEADMADAGIDVASSRENNSLKIHSIANHRKDQITKIVEEFVKNAKGRTLRIAIQHDRFTRAQQRDLLLIEEFVQTLFERHDVFVLNIYNTEFMDDAKFMQQIISIHDYTIFAPDFGKGIVIKTK